MKSKYYIFGAGSYGRIAYESLKDKVDFVGFLDNNVRSAIIRTGGGGIQSN